VEHWWERNGLTEAFFKGGKVTVLSGAAKGQTTTIKGLTFQDYDLYGKGAEGFLKFVFEEPIDLSGSTEKDMGILVQMDRRDEGCTGQTVGHWMGAGASLSSEVDPDGFGRSCLLLDAGQGKAFYRAPTSYQKFIDNNGTWIITFKAKAASDDAKLVLRADPGGAETIDLDDEWEEHEVKMDVSGFSSAGGERSSMVTFLLSSLSGQVLIDDMTVRKDEV